MRNKNVVLFIGCIALLMFSVVAAPALAGGGFEPPPPGATILGPEIWGVIVIYCDVNDLATVRVKRVVGCNVETDALVEPNWLLGCPANAAVLEGQSLPVETTFFNLTDRTAFINKVKNFNHQGTVVSCDAQFKFWQ